VEWRDAHAAGALIGDRYRLLSPLARGGFGAVYEAEQITTERRVAIKLLVRHPEDESIDRMLGEARIASRLSSEHIVQVLDAGIDPSSSTVFVAMELLSGLTLSDLVERRGPLPSPDVAEYIRQIASGLDKAHGHVDRAGRASPIVHRDLKPANVFVTSRDDGSALLKILDFGTAKMLSSNAPSSRIVRGTPQYMAPEQLAGDVPTPATDLWALGLVTFYLLTARSYWLAVAKEAPAEALFGEIHSLPLASASERARVLGVPIAVGPAFDTWFQRCVNRDPARRFQNAGVAARELALAFGGGSRVTPTLVAPRQEPPAAAPPHTEQNAVVSSSPMAPKVSLWRPRNVVMLLGGLVLLGGAVELLLGRWRDKTPEVEVASAVTAQTSATPAESASAAEAPSPVATPAGASSVAETGALASSPPANTSRPKSGKLRRPDKTPPAQPTSGTTSTTKPRPNVYEIR
jgi:serine/threonine-protein kinase